MSTFGFNGRGYRLEGTRDVGRRGTLDTVRTGVTVLTEPWMVKSIIKTLVHRSTLVRRKRR